MSTLDARVQKFKDEIIYIGASSASAFFFVGRYDDYETEIDDVVPSRLQAFRRDVKNNRIELKRAQNRLKIAKSLLLKAQREGFKRAIEDQEHYLKKVEEEIEYLQELIERNQAKVDFTMKFPDIRQREVVDEYDRLPCIDGGRIFIIEGYENGRLWCLSEREGGEHGRSIR